MAIEVGSGSGSITTSKGTMKAVIPGLQAHWKLGANNDGTDLSGNENDLTNTNVHPLPNFPNIEFGATSWLSRSDTDLAAGFPFSIGDTTKNVSVFAKFRVADTGNNQWMVSKYSTASMRAWAVTVSAADALTVYLGNTDGTSGIPYVYGTTISRDTWYSVGFTYNNTTNQVTIVLYDADGNVVGTPFSDTHSYNVGTYDTYLMIGTRETDQSTYDMDGGHLSHVSIYNSILSQSDFGDLELGVTVPTDYSSCHAAYLYDTTDSGLDSSGKNNWLHIINTVIPHITWLDGGGGAFFDGTADYELSDASMSPAFPLKSGLTNPEFTIMLAYKFYADPGSPNYIVTMLDFTLNDRTFMLSVDHLVTNCLKIGFGKAGDGGASQESIVYTGHPLFEGHWYHIAVTYKDTTKAYTAFVYDLDTDTMLGSGLSGTTTDNINVDDTALTVGCILDAGTPAYQMVDGTVDEIRVYNTVLTEEQIAAVRGETARTGEETLSSSSWTEIPTASQTSTGSSTRRYAQTFKALSDFNLSKMAVSIAQTGTPVENVKFELYTCVEDLVTSPPDPTSLLAASMEVLTTSLPEYITPGGSDIPVYTEFVFPTTAIETGKQYALVMCVDEDETGQVVWYGGESQTTYTNGALWYDDYDDVWLESSGGDRYFKLYELDGVQEVPGSGSGTSTLTAGTMKGSTNYSASGSGTISTSAGTMKGSMHYSASGSGSASLAAGTIHAVKVIYTSGSGSASLAAGTIHAVKVISGSGDTTVILTGFGSGDIIICGHGSGSLALSKGTMKGSMHYSARASGSLALSKGTLKGSMHYSARASGSLALSRGTMKGSMKSGSCHGLIRFNGTIQGSHKKAARCHGRIELKPKTIAGMFPLPLSVRLDGDYGSPVQHLDDEWQRNLGITADVEAAEVSYFNSPFAYDLSLDVKVDFSIDVVSGIGLDLLRLIPGKFKTEQHILIDYVHECEFQIAGWLSKVADLIKLLNPRTVNSVEYIRNLGALIGVEFSPEDESSPDEMRRTLMQATEWYRSKGTYQAVHIIALIQQFHVTICDLYTNDYVTFVPVEWWAGNEDENPPGLDGSYYKSPHFGVSVDLNKVFTSILETGGAPVILKYLWIPEYIDNFYNTMEQNRPVHTVPHYTLRMEAITDEYGTEYEAPGEIVTKAFDDWEQETFRLDEVPSRRLDDTPAERFDADATAFFNSVTDWKLGNGTGETFTMESEQHSGTIDSVTIAPDTITYIIMISKATALDEITELALYIPGTPDNLVVSSYFPSISKGDRTELRIEVIVHRSSLS